LIKLLQNSTDILMDDALINTLSEAKKSQDESREK
jgi:hypothetical protein